MDIKVDLERVIWHEIGHLCMDIILCSKNSEFEIYKIEFNYNSIANGRKWGGVIGCKNPKIPSVNDLLVCNNLELFCLKFLNLYSGCIFELNYLNDFHNQSLNINDLFAIDPSKSGTSDYQSLRDLNNEFSKYYKIDKKEFDFNYVKMIKNIFENKFSKMNDFKSKLKFISEKYFDVVYSNFESNFNNEYVYKFTEELKNNLIDDLNKIFDSTDFFKFIDSIIEDMLIFLGNRIESEQK